MQRARLITPTQATQVTQALQSLKPTRSLDVTQSLKPDVSFKRQRQILQAQKSKQVQTFLSNYNDPTELNSYIDALTNREAVSKKFGDTWGTLSTISGTVSVLSFAGSIIAGALATFIPVTAPVTAPLAAALSTTSKVAAIPAIPAAIDVTYNTGIKPILAGKPKEAGLNLLMNLGETMDFSANPVKGLILDGPKGFVKGMGWSSEGRVNYDYDTGFFLTDMLLELVTDPLNWVDMGTGVALKNATKSAVEPTAKLVTDSAVKTINGTFAKTIGEITTEGSENILKQTNKTMAQVSREWAEASADGFIKQAEKLARQTGVTKPFKLLSKTEQDALIKQVKERMLRDGRTKIQQSLVSSIKKELPKASASEIDLILKQAGREAADAKNLANAMLEISDITFDTLSSDVIKGLSSIQNISDSYQRFMTKGAMMTSGYGLGFEVAKNGWYGIRKWANELTLRNLRKPQLFDNKNGLDIKQYSKAKNIWKATQRYVYDMTGDVSQRDINSFYVFMQQQFNRDKQFISKIFQDEPSPLKVAARLDAQFKELYGCEFKEYIGYIKGINDAENGIYKFYTNYLENLNASLESKAFTKPMNIDIKSGKNLFNVNDLSAINIIKQLQDIANTKDFTKLDTFDKLYTIKLNNAYVNAILVKDKNISQVLDEIASDERIGALLDKIINDLKTMEPERSTMLNTYVRIVKEAGLSFSNVKELYNNVANIALQKVPGIPATKLRYYILDQIFGLNMSVSQALAAFDNITMPAIKNGLETLLYDKGFKIANYPALEEQISRVLKQYLEAQQHANIDDLSATIVQDFTDSIEGLLVNLPQYRTELAELAAANDTIKSILSNVRETNLGLLENIFTTKDTIFGVANVRKLTNAGLALNTIANIENLDLFEFSADISGNIVKSANMLGKRINKLKEDLAQYAVFFNDEMSENIRNVYEKFRKQFLDNPNFTQYLDMPAFAYLKNTENTYEQFAQLVEFYKLVKDDKVLSRKFKGILTSSEDFQVSVYHNVLNPNRLLVTDFAWDAMAQSAWIAEKQFNDHLLINSITAYRNLGLYSKKITNDFQAMRDLFSANKLDRVKMLQQERYIKAASKINDMLEDVERVYDDLFDTTTAKERIETLREILNNIPELNEKYNDLVDTLEKYWSGEITFEQSPKSRRGAADFVDTFTPFWDKIKEMNQAIRVELVEQSKKNSVLKKYLNYTDVTPWDPIRQQQDLNKLIDDATDLNAKGAFYNVFNWSADELKNELAYRFRFITFTDEDINSTQLRDMYKKFEKNIPEGVIHVHENNRHWFILSPDQKIKIEGRQAYLNDNPIVRIQKKKQFNEFQLADDYIKDTAKVKIVDTLNELDDTLETLTGAHLGDSQGEFLDKNALETLFKLNEFGTPEYLPDEVWKAFGGTITETSGAKTYKFDFDKIYTTDQFSIPRFNESILGTIKSKNSLGMFSSNMLINTRNAMIRAQAYLKPKNEYINTVFDSMHSIASPNSIWANFSDEDLLTALQTNPEYKLVALVDDKKYGVKVREIIPTSITAIQKGKELGAVIVPSQTFKDMYNVVNHRLGSEGFAKLWSRIMYMYKFGYLCRPGAWIRNFIDTNLKSRLEMGGEYKTYNDLAHRILNDVDSMKKFIQARSQDGVIRSDAIKEYFEGNYAKVLTYEQFIELDRDFLSRSISGNIMNDLYKTAGGDLWNTFTELTGNIVEFGNKTENYNRLATYLYELDHGADYTTALSKLAKVHFDYSFKTKAEQLAEMVFPFTTFSLRNYSYWIEMLEKHPWIMRNYTHLMKPHWDFKDYTPEELARDYRVQSQILNGQLKLAEFNNKVITFKANPSIQDAIRMFIDPINAVYEKLATPLAAATGEYTQPENMLPIIGPIISSAKSMFKTGTPLPSAIGVQPTPRRTGIDFRNKNLSGINTFRDKQYRTPNYRKNVVYDSYATRGVNRYRTHMYPVIDIAHDIKMRYTVNVYNRIKNKVKTDVYQGIRYRIKLDANRFR